MTKTLKLITASFALILASVAFSQESTITVEAKDRVATPTKEVTNLYTEFKPMKPNYFFGTVGASTGGKSTSAFTLGYGYEVYRFADQQAFIAVEGAYTRLNGKKLRHLGNDGTGHAYNIDKRNVVELGGKIGYQFAQTKPFDVRVYGKAGLATTTFSDASHITPYVGAGVEFTTHGNPFVFDLSVKTYTNARKAEITYNPDTRGDRFNTKKALTTINFGVSYHF